MQVPELQNNSSIKQSGNVLFTWKSTLMQRPSAQSQRALLFFVCCPSTIPGCCSWFHVPERLLSDPFSRPGVGELFWLIACMHECICSCSVMSDFLRPHAPQTVARQTPLSTEILQARILEWGAISSSRGSSQPRDRTHGFPASPALAGGFFTAEPPGKFL